MTNVEARKRLGLGLMMRYINDSDFLETEYRLPSIREVLGHNRDALGVARFIELPSFESERLYTLIFTATEIRIDAVVGATSLWASFPSVAQTVHEDGTYSEPFEVQKEPFDPDDALRRSTVIALPTSTEIFRSWSSFMAAANVAVSCDTSCLDGISYRHRFCNDQESEHSVEWSNPEELEHAPQLRLIAAYIELLRSAGVYVE